jgi:hypothetical protein
MCTLSMRIVTYLIEYLVEFIFKTILDYESGDQMGLLMQKNRRRKSHAWASLNLCDEQHICRVTYTVYVYVEERTPQWRGLWKNTTKIKLHIFIL